MPEAQNNWRRKTILFLVSQSVTLLGSQIVQMAVVWYVTLHTASGVWVAAFSVCSYLPQFFISFWGGVWADRYSRKRLIICADGEQQLSPWECSSSFLIFLRAACCFTCCWYCPFSAQSGQASNPLL